MRFDLVHAAFSDELEKIAGELQGFTRIGRRPIGVERMLERESESEVRASDIVAPEATPSVTKLSAVPYKALALLGAGAGGYHVVNKANKDRQIGRAMRLQQNAMS